MVRIKVILGSTREGRFGEQPARWIFEEIKKREGIEAEFIDLRDYPLPFFNEPSSPSMNKGVYANAVAGKLAQKIAEADGFVIATPEYNHGYPAALKNAMDFIYNEWGKKPVGFVSWGGVGGARAVEQLRQVAIELGMVPIRNTVPIVNFWALLDGQGKLKTETLAKNADDFIGQLFWWAKALKAARSETA